MEPPESGVRWYALALEIPAEREDTVIGLLGRESLGVESTPATPGRTALRIYGLDVPDLGTVAACLRDAGLESGAYELRVEPVADGRWLERYQAALAPFPLGTRFLVDPGGPAPLPDPGPRAVLRLVPGGAFGTGEHPTTQLCAEMLERCVEAGSRWVDLGCGTAILALVAARCGAREVRALDIDGEAIRVAQEVLAANPAAGVTVVQGSVLAAAGHFWDGVVCNVDTGFLVASARSLAGLLRFGGRLVASGFLEAEAATLETAQRSAGLRVEHQASRAGWGVLVARRVA